MTDLARAAFELGLARLRLGSQHARALIAAAPAVIVKLDARQAGLVERVAFFIPRVAARLPWRTDCLVQALAAQRWLGRNAIATTLTLGVQRDKPSDFEAHAWLTAGDRIVTGGDISGYVPLTRP
ncbi:MAG: lasso peptide biosynthesis B2 protein [Sphingomicrobium sp.]